MATVRKGSTAKSSTGATHRGGVLSDRCCVVVANGLRARFFVLEETAQPRARYRLAEQTGLNNAVSAARGADAPGVRTERNTSRQLGPMHPIGEKRAQHRAEIERRFAHEIAAQVKKLFGSWKSGLVVLSANPKMLGMLRESVQAALQPTVRLEQIRHDYTALTPSALMQQLQLSGGK